ncbi:T9SS type A sorting domain-containing protein [Hymenobacter busanensis]|uniref:T9SS type A sorting domain-containing protein n=1 Tax=Hymenobacter busanensis TaxID=2607656 RepID=A0A7L4ZUH8_9BACT|nr:T9SS type A sorting domain-containing protein [Hymenobacter busanensis]KAA9327166.1 T9SS type A sorting domain-containing protein [Hymenobacter busanensis]QHJ05832.1 T9SS type A sorting domain-containing protein [Hymenobacter busanensis]
MHHFVLGLLALLPLLRNAGPRVAYAAATVEAFAPPSGFPKAASSLTPADRCRDAPLFSHDKLNHYRTTNGAGCRFGLVQDPSPDSLVLFRLYPPPGREQLVLELNAAVPLAAAQFRLLDGDGHELLKVPLRARRLNLDLSRHAAGTYVLEVRSAGQLYTQKVVHE